jgi:hypothetical protein
VVLKLSSPTGRTLAAVVALLAWALTFAAASPSQAHAQEIEERICLNYPSGSHGHCPPIYARVLTGVRSHSTSSLGTCAGAWVTYPNNFYANYACQGVDSYHPYGAGNTLRGAVHNNTDYGNYLTGWQYFNY